MTIEPAKVAGDSKGRPPASFRVSGGVRCIALCDLDATESLRQGCGRVAEVRFLGSDDLPLSPVPIVVQPCSSEDSSQVFFRSGVFGSRALAAGMWFKSNLRMQAGA